VLNVEEILSLTPKRFEHFLRYATRIELERVLRHIWSAARENTPLVQPEMQGAFNAGCRAGASGKARKSNPFAANRDLALLWDAGWLKGKESLVLRVKN